MAKRVLVLDDDIGVLEAIETALTYEGFEVRTLGRTYNIFKNIQDFNPDVLILDLFLGGINGAELCKKIKNNRETQDLAVIIISAYKTNIDVLHSFGCDHFIPKPFDLAELYQGINKVLRMNKLAID
jgi:DNA-binding response OmpR family regulator